jgi:hypothetical protein
MGIGAGLLPWPKDLPLDVATKCYRSARNAAKTDAERATEAIAKIRKLIENGERFIDATNEGQADRPIKIPPKSIGVRFTKDGRLKYGILDAAMTKILRTKNAKAIFIKRLAKAGIVSNGHGHAGTVQERLKIERDGKIIERPRLWVIDSQRFSCIANTIGRG